MQKAKSWGEAVGFPAERRTSLSLILYVFFFLYFNFYILSATWKYSVSFVFYLCQNEVAAAIKTSQPLQLQLQQGSCKVLPHADMPTFLRRPAEAEAAFWAFVCAFLAFHRQKGAWQKGWASRSLGHFKPYIPSLGKRKVAIETWNILTTISGDKLLLLTTNLWKKQRKSSIIHHGRSPD